MEHKARGGRGWVGGWGGWGEREGRVGGRVAAWLGGVVDSLPVRRGGGGKAGLGCPSLKITMQGARPEHRVGGMHQGRLGGGGACARWGGPCAGAGWSPRAGLGWAGLLTGLRVASLPFSTPLLCARVTCTCCYPCLAVMQGS